MARTHKDAARTLLRNAETFVPPAGAFSGDPRTAFHHAAITIELCLKAYLIDHGRCGDLHGHDLARLLQAARRRGLGVQPLALHTLALLLGDPYRHHMLRRLTAPFGADLAVLLARDVVTDLHHWVRAAIDNDQ